MYITLESDYAVRIVSELCIDGGRVDAGTLSQRCGVTLRFSLKILRKLTAAGIVCSFKGSRGGYKAVLDPKDINLRMVIEAIEGTYYFSRCLSEDYVCTRTMDEECCYHNAFAQITDVVRRELESRNFADLTKCVKGIRESENGQGKIQA